MSSPAATATEPPVPSTPGFDREAWRRTRMRELETENLLLRGERDRTEQLLAQALVWMSNSCALTISELVDVLCFAIDTNPAQAATQQ